MRYGDLTSFQTGVAVPLFSLHSKHSIGIGEYLDLIPFAQWSKFCGFNIIQLLPVNDTGSESSPYSARSAFALNPVFINVQSVTGASKFETEIENAREQFADIKRIDYYRIT
ncbi:MAG: 4-alpha-glucanotransferase, partial [Clostridia bacterium]|nr:4-alpha-glucanotransferase [Clostridia bacterium]